MQKCVFIFIWILFSKVSAQNITAYVNTDGAFYIFENGSSAQYENQAPISFKVGNSCVAYVDVNQNFKVYYKGEIIKPIDELIVGNYWIADDQVWFTADKNCYVFDGVNTRKLLSGNFYYNASANVIPVHEFDSNVFQVYYQNKLITLATPNSNLQYKSLSSAFEEKNCYFKSAENTLAYLVNDTLKVFWIGQTYNVFVYPKQTRDMPPLQKMYYDFQVGKNIVCYTDPLTQKLSIFYKGSNFTLTSRNVGEIHVYDDMVSYRDSTGLNVFYAGSKYLLDDTKKITENPLRFTGTPFARSGSGKDSVLLFCGSGQCKIFNKGIVTVIDNISGCQYKISGNTIAWVDKMNNLSVFYKGKTYTLSTLIKPADFEVHGNTVTYTIFPGECKVFCDGKIY